ncbi:MAG: nitroreductase family protein [Verrucomicrobiaceae bacterium]|nr:nitroreductase family protein [Verrucomicrobiaceae bacterium]
MKKDSAIFTRRSIRAYDSSKRVSKEQLNDLLDAAMHAPSAMDAQPWEFLVATDETAINTIMASHPYCSSLKDAGAAIIVCGNLDKEFKTPCGGYYQYDCSAATQNILLRAKELGLGTCWCGVAPEVERMQAFRNSLGIPANVEPMAFIIIGYPAEDPKLEKPRFDETKIHWQKW